MKRTIYESAVDTVSVNDKTLHQIFRYFRLL